MTRSAVDRAAMMPLVYVVAGSAGSGKTTLGRALARACDAAIVDQDVLTNPLMAEIARMAGISVDLDQATLRGPIRQARYRCVLDTALDNIAVGRPVVLVAPFSTETRDAGAWADAFAPFAPAPVVLIWVSVSPAVARDRRRRRGLPRDLAAALDDLPLPAPAPLLPHVAVDGAAATAIEVARILQGRSFGPA